MSKSSRSGGEAAGLVKRLSGMTAHPPQERAWEDIARLVDDLGKASGDEADKARIEAAFLLSARTHTAEAELVEFYGTLLPRLGPEAVPQVIMNLLRRMEDDPKFKPDLAALAGDLLPHLVNRLLADRHPVHEPLRQAALEALPRLAELSEESARDFLDTANRAGVKIAYGIYEVLTGGAYGNSVHNEINDAALKIGRKQRPDKGLAASIVRHSVFRSPEFAKALTPVLETKHAPTLAASLLAILRGRPGADSKLAMAAARTALHPDPAVKSRAIASLIACAPKDQGKLLASLCKKDPALKEMIPAQLPFLPAREYSLFMKAMGDESGAMTSKTAAVLAGLDPEAVRTRLQSLAEGPHAEGAKKLASLAPSYDLPDDFDTKTAVKAFKPAKKKTAKPKKKDKEGFFSRLGGGGGGSGGEGISIQFDDTSVSNSEYGGKKISPIYEGRTLTHIDFTDAFLENAVFHQCTFVKVKFVRTLLVGARFTNCIFENCDLTEAKFHDCTLADVQAGRSNLKGLVLSGCDISMLAVTDTDMRGLRMHGTNLRTCRFTACDLSGLLVHESICSGSEFVLCRCLRPTFDKARLSNHILASSAMPGPIFEGLYSDHPNLMRLEDSCLYSRAEGMAVHGLPKAPALKGKVLAAAAAMLADWFKSRDLRASMVAFQENNLRREAWCLDKLGPEKAAFYHMAPYLLHSDVFERHTEDLEPLPLPCRMAGYEPGYTVIEATREFFPGAQPPSKVPDPINIEALYTIGSVGTVAQTPASDLDYWVCYDPEDMPEVLVDGLTDKLEHIEKWADEVFDLEVHFFTMDLTRIQENNFGFSDQESSGSAQALLLKEEFYRTAVCVSGKVPLWWMTPVGTSDKAYAAAREFASKSGAADRFADLGNLVEIPPSEFFGASLWQIVKALKSPFKSIMKFGLLEKYIATGDASNTMLLCDRLKANLLLGRTGINQSDPYLLLFREVSSHYARAKEKDSLTLVRLSFFLKTKLKALFSSGAIPLRSEERQLIDQFAGEKSAADEDWSFQRLEHIGGLVNKFIVRTYMRVRDKQSEHSDIAITPEDLTKLGRKIFSNFSKRKHKIEHMPFLSIGGNTFRVLHFQASGKKMGRPVGWEIQGAQQMTGKDRLELVDLRKGNDLAEILVWLASNKLYVPGIEARGDYSISPVTARDLQALLDSLVNFFPGSTFNTDVGEMLKKERIVKAFFILNLVQPREQNNLSEATVVYSTNWGELFCRTFAVQNSSLLNNPAQFMLENLEQDFDSPPEMDFFVPDRSSCPKPSI